MASGPITSWEIDGETLFAHYMGIYFGGLQNHMVIAAMKLKNASSLEEKL